MIKWYVRDYFVYTLDSEEFNVYIRIVTLKTSQTIIIEGGPYYEKLVRRSHY